MSNYQPGDLARAMENAGLSWPHCRPPDTAAGLSGASDATPANTPGLHLDAGKPQIDGIDPILFEAIGKILEYGAKKYAKYNWIKGIHFTRIYASAMRHMLKWYECDDIDEESGLPHLWHAVTNLMFLITYTEHGRYNKFDDRPFCDNGEAE